MRCLRSGHDLRDWRRLQRLGRIPACWRTRLPGCISRRWLGHSLPDLCEDLQQAANLFIPIIPPVHGPDPMDLPAEAIQDINLGKLAIPA